MKPLPIIQHLEREHPGIFSRVLEERSFPSHTLRTYEGDPVPERSVDFSGLLVMVEAMNVDQTGRYPHLEREMRLSAGAHREGVPVLGICLGSQLAAAAFGAAVYQGGTKEIGWYELGLTPAAAQDLLFRDFPGRFTVLQWHGQTFDLPEGAVRLVSSRNYPNQAFRLGNSSWGIQFHLETDGDLVRLWL